MTKDGIKKCIGLLAVTYPAIYKDFKADQYGMLIQLWEIQFNQCDDLDVWVALNKAIGSCKFVPSIADIKEQLISDNSDCEEDIWQVILKAGKNALYSSQEEYQKLPEDLKKIVTPGTLKEIALADNDSLRFIKKDILASYRSSSQKKRQEKLLTTMPVVQTKRIV